MGQIQVFLVPRRIKLDFRINKVAQNDDIGAVACRVTRLLAGRTSDHLICFEQFKWFSSLVSLNSVLLSVRGQAIMTHKRTKYLSKLAAQISIRVVVLNPSS